MYSVTIDTTRAWISDPTLPGSDAVVCGTNLTTGRTSTLDGQFRAYAGNLVSLEVYDGDQVSLPVTLRHLSPTQRDQILAWRGQVLLFRTVDGLRMFGAYLSAVDRRVLRTVPEDESDDLVTYDVDVVFTQVSYNEAV